MFNIMKQEQNVWGLQKKIKNKKYYNVLNNKKSQIK